ncbi:MAG: hypothetical protein AB7F22_22030 [Reyranella sp.]|uniref:hypothetical protein n=1 Tax=Reyranella sp. TaxID=1929291 RepID=UPI003D0CBF52
MFASADSARTALLWKAPLAILAGVAALTFAGAAQADPPWKKRWKHHHYYEPNYVVVKPRYYRPPPPVYVVPEPVMVYPQPYSYGPSYPPSVNFNFSLPMR